MKKILFIIMFCIIESANAEISSSEFTQLKSRVGLIEKIVMIDRSVDQMIDYFSNKDLKLKIDLNISIKERSNLFIISKTCFDDVIKSYPNKRFNFDTVEFTSSKNIFVRAFPSRFARMSIGAKSSVDHCRTLLVTEGLRD